MYAVKRIKQATILGTGKVLYKYMKLALVGLALMFSSISITMAASNSNAFITTWQTDISDYFNNYNDREIVIPAQGTGYNYSIDWGDDSHNDNVTGSIAHTNGQEGTYSVSITGVFPHFYTAAENHTRLRLVSIEQWGDIQWRSIESAFLWCNNLVLNATDQPGLSQVSSMKNMFSFANLVNRNINHWDVSSVTSINGMFAHAFKFNRSLASWDTSSVLNMSSMFASASSFNHPIEGSDISNVRDMRSMFKKNGGFKHSLSD